MQDSFSWKIVDSIQLPTQRPNELCQNFVLMCLGPIKSHQNRSYNIISEKNYNVPTYITLGGKMLKHAMAQNSMYTKIECCQWFNFSNNTKLTLFWCVGCQINHLIIKVMTKSVKK